MLDGTHFFECECGSDEHTLRFTLDKEDGDIHTSVFLNQYRPWWKRIYVAIRYVLGYNCKYGHWDNWILNRDDAYRLRSMCDEIIEGTEHDDND